MKNILIYLALTLALLILGACGGAGGGDSQAPTTIVHTLSFVSSGNGAVTGKTSQTVNHGANSTVITAVPSSGYHFLNWTDGVNVVSTTAAVEVTNVTIPATQPILP